MLKRLLFVTYGGGHAKIIRALTDEILRFNHPLDLTVLGLTTATSSFHGSGVTPVGFRHLVQPGDEEALKLGESLHAAMAPNHSVPDQESSAYLGLSFYDLAERVGEEEAHRRYKQEGRQCFLPLSPLRRAFDLYKPDLVVTTNSPRAEEAAILVAGERGIPSICIMDLFGGFDLPRISKADYASKVCVLSDQVRQTLIKAGRPAADVVVTGNPAFDSYADPAVAAEAERWKRAMGWKGKKLVLWASQTEPTDIQLSLRILDRLVEGLKDQPDVQIIFRPHPSETLNLSNLPDHLHISTQREPLSTVVKASDCVVVISSTVGLEACLLGVPLVSLTIPITMETAPYADDGLALEARSLDDLPGVVKECLAGKRAPGAPLPEVGQAAHKIVQQILELVQL